MSKQLFPRFFAGKYPQELEARMKRDLAGRVVVFVTHVITPDGTHVLSVWIEEESKDGS